MLLRLGTISFACLLLFFSGCRDDNKREPKSATKDAIMSDCCNGATGAQAVHMSTAGSIRPSGFDQDKNEDTPPQSPTNTSVFHEQTR